MINISKILLEICGDDEVLNPDCELIDSGILDSFALIELLSRLEDLGIEIIPTRIDKNVFKTPGSIQKYIDDIIVKISV